MSIAERPSGSTRSSKAANPLGLALLATAVLVPLLAPLAAIVLLWGRWVNWRDVAMLAAMYVACAAGITVGYHRMLTHRSFEAHPVVRFLLLALGAMSAMGPALAWATTHLQHHAHPDEDGDPHSPWDWVDDVQRIRRTGLRRFLRAHFLWAILGEPITPNRASQELARDPLVRFMSRWPVVVAMIALGFVIPYLVGGWQCMLWAGLVRLGLTHHVTWSINSVCHVWGRRMFETRDCSRNNWVFGLLALGEGWHNNHHAFPRSAFHGLRWYQVDVSGYIIRGLESIGLVRRVWRIPDGTLRARLREAPQGE